MRLGIVDPGVEPIAQEPAQKNQEPPRCRAKEPRHKKSKARTGDQIRDQVDHIRVQRQRGHDPPQFTLGDDRFRIDPPRIGEWIRALQDEKRDQDQGIAEKRASTRGKFMHPDRWRPPSPTAQIRHLVQFDLDGLSTALLHAEHELPRLGKSQ